MTDIAILLRDYSTKDSLDALYYAARSIKQAYFRGNFQKDIFDDDARSAPSSDARSLTRRLIEAIETDTGKHATEFTKAEFVEAIDRLIAGGEGLSTKFTAAEERRAYRAMVSMVDSSVHTHR